MFRYRRRGRGQSIPYGKSIADGVVYGHGSVVGMVNIAYVLGWKRFVLVRLGLFDHHYLYMPLNKTREVEKKWLTYASAFASGSSIADQNGDWPNGCPCSTAPGWSRRKRTRTCDPKRPPVGPCST